MRAESGEVDEVARAVADGWMDGGVIRTRVMKRMAMELQVLDRHDAGCHLINIIININNINIINIINMSRRGGTRGI
jgi:hypothetical protein